MTRLNARAERGFSMFIVIMAMFVTMFRFVFHFGIHLILVIHSCLHKKSPS